MSDLAPASETAPLAGCVKSADEIVKQIYRRLTNNPSTGKPLATQLAAMLDTGQINVMQAINHVLLSPDFHHHFVQTRPKHWILQNLNDVLLEGKGPPQLIHAMGEHFDRSAWGARIDHFAAGVGILFHGDTTYLNRYGVWRVPGNPLPFCSVFDNYVWEKRTS